MGLKFKVEAVDIFLERRKTRMLVGQLTMNAEQFVFTYNEKYFRAKNVIPLGIEFPLTKREFRSSVLFPSLEDRIPSRANSAYSDYCLAMGISSKEHDPLILLSTIGRRGPSSFVFMPVFARSFTSQDVVEFRRVLGLTTREFAHIFELSQSSLNALERGRQQGKDLIKRLELFALFPETALYALKLHGGILPHSKLQYAISVLKSKMSATI